MRVTLLVGLSALLADCSSAGIDRTVLMEGIRPGVSGKAIRIDDREALRTGRLDRSSWVAEVRERGRTYRHRRFDNPSRREFTLRLHRLAVRYGFEIVSERVLRPRQDAPMIIVRTTHYLRLARATRAILTELDPPNPGKNDRWRWRYEGFYWEARDERGIPFLIANTLIRGPHLRGQQWARSEPLFPYPHG